MPLLAKHFKELRRRRMSRTDATSAKPKPAAPAKPVITPHDQLMAQIRAEVHRKAIERNSKKRPAHYKLHRE